MRLLPAAGQRSMPWDYGENLHHICPFSLGKMNRQINSCLCLAEFANNYDSFCEFEYENIRMDGNCNDT